MNEQLSTSGPGGIPQEKWEKAIPAGLPKPTYWPFFLAVGIGFIFWGLLAAWMMLVVGIIVTFIALTRWVILLDHERK
jgi:hypothetical protein